MPHFCAFFRVKRLAEVKQALDKRNAHYPTPEEPQRCVVCRQVTATIACMECPNKVCQACVTRECLDKEDSFLYFHHQHCLRCGGGWKGCLLHGVVVTDWEVDVRETCRVFGALCRHICDSLAISAEILRSVGDTPSCTSSRPSAARRHSRQKLQDIHRSPCLQRWNSPFHVNSVRQAEQEETVTAASPLEVNNRLACVGNLPL